MADRKESSVLFQLKELKGIEQKRVVEEEEQRLREEQARVHAQLQAEQRVRAEHEARRMAIEQAERERIDNENRRRREEQLKVEVAARLASVHQEGQVEQHRLSQEMAALAQKATKTRPVALTLVAVLLLGAVGYLGYYLREQRLAAAARERANQARLEAIRVEIARIQGEVDTLLATRRQVRDQRIAATIDQVPDVDGKLAVIEGQIRDKKEELRAKKSELSQPAANRPATRPTSGPASGKPAAGAAPPAAAPAEPAAPAAAPAAEPAAPAAQP